MGMHELVSLLVMAQGSVKAVSLRDSSTRIGFEVNIYNIYIYMFTPLFLYKIDLPKHRSRVYGSYDT